MGETGGCQCGAVRFRVDGELGRPSLCHCRMCQKAFGGPFGPLISVKVAELVWTRGEPTRFQSSNKVRRGFCPACGTPLTFEASEKVIDIAICAFDNPAPLKPQIQLARESRLPWIDDLGAIPWMSDQELAAAASHYEGLVSYQHPDHDTEAWPGR